MTPNPPTPYSQPFPPRGTGRVNWLSAFSGFAVGLVAATLIWVQVLPPERSGSDQSEFVLVPGDLNPNTGDATEGGGETRQIVTGGRGGRSGDGGVAVGGGESAAGPDLVSDAPPGSVTGNLIKLGATVAEDGIAKAFLGEVRFGMEAVRARINASGGIEGRQLEIIYKEDAWDPRRGQDFIRRLILEDKVFALAVSPSSEGLNSASGAGLFRDHGVPVVGADGLNNTQFLDPWIWPVAAATTTQVHVIMKDAWDRCQSNAACRDKGGLRPAIVFGNTYRFGVEGAFAFNGAYCRLTGGTFTGKGECNGGRNVPGFTPGGTACQANPPTAGRFCGIEAGKNPVQERGTVQTACKQHGDEGPCNFILLLLEPATALAWMGGFDAATAFESDSGCCGMAGAQPLFTSNFGVECKTKCHKMRVWTGYNPPIGAYANNQAVADYVRGLKAQNSRADEFNQFTMGGFIGMELLEAALRQVGRDLTREALVSTLNSMPPLKTGLTTPDGLRWTAQDRYANQSAQSFSIQYPVNRFTGWNPESPYTRDPWLGKDNVLP